MYPIILQVCLLDQRAEALPRRGVPDVPRARRRVAHYVVPRVVQILAFVHRQHNHLELRVLEYALGEAQQIMADVRAEIEVRQCKVRQVREVRMGDVRADLHIKHPQMGDVLQERAAVRDAQADEEVPFVAEGVAEEGDLAEAREEGERAPAGAALVLVDGLADHEERAERGRGEGEVLDGGARAEDVHLARGRGHTDALRPERADVLAEVRRERAARGGGARGARRGEDDDVRERCLAVDERPEEVGERELARPAGHKRDGGGGGAREGSGVFEDLHEDLHREKGL